MADVEIDAVDGIATLTINRPQRRNGITGAVVEDLIRGLQGIAADVRHRVVVVTGAGGSFCSGMDLSEPVTPDSLTFMRRVGVLCAELRALPVPTIAKVRGPAMGFGANLALCCDLVVAADDAVFGEIFAERGLTLDGGGSWSLPRLVGLAKAKEIAFFGQRISGTDAVGVGMANRCVPEPDLDEVVAEWAATLARGPRRALSTIKASLNASFDRSFHDALEAEAVAQALSFGSPEAKEGVLAFREKRVPDFRRSP